MRAVHSADRSCDALDGDCPDLLGLRLAVPQEPGDRRRKQHLEGVDALDAGRDRHDRQDTAPESGGRIIGPVIAHDDARASFVRFRPA